jgi:hypothetical protein
MLPNHPEILEWPVLAEHDWRGLILGNGASRAVWSRFEYDSLYDLSSSATIENPLGPAERAVFAAADGTRNFEEALRWLGITARVNQALGLDEATPRARYENIRRALIQSVRWVHPAWVQVPDFVKAAVRDAMLPYEWVYSTNYDLLVYWSMMHEHEGDGFRDFLWNGHFEPSDTDVEGAFTRVAYLHGALHLERRSDGRTHKRTWAPGGDLLTTFQQAEPGESWPLFVSEGTHADKTRAIASSDYLTFAYEQLSGHKGGLVICGHSLDEADRHLVRAIRASSANPVAISIHQPEVPNVIGRVYSYRARLPDKELYFFDSSTHPITDPGLLLA